MAAIRKGVRYFDFLASKNWLLKDADGKPVDGLAVRSDRAGGLIDSTNPEAREWYWGYDAAGNTSSYTGASFLFNQRGRMNSATTSGGTTSYIYNALGELIEKSGAGGTTLLMYDESGHLFGEYSSTGALIQETVWMGEIPVATLRPNGSTVSIYYVHTDHLNAPRVITQSSDNSVREVFTQTC